MSGAEEDRHGARQCGCWIADPTVLYDQGRFGRLFPTLPPFAADTPLVRDALAELGAPGGLMDAGDDLSDPITLITDPAKSTHNPDNLTMTAGLTFLGQFLDHDMTFDPTSSLARRQDPESIRNFRIPALDLDSLYGGGPVASPHLYDQSIDGGRTTFLTEEIPGSSAVSVDGVARHDLPRNSQAVALVGDPRNDENLVVSQLHLALLRFHNAVVADVKAELGPGYTADEIFAEAQRTVRPHGAASRHDHLPGDPQPAARPHHGRALGSARRPGDEAATTRARRPRRPRRAAAAQAHAIVVLHPAGS